MRSESCASTPVAFLLTFLVCARMMDVEKTLASQTKEE